MKRRLGQVGDTIVEVMLAVAVVSSVIGGSFAVVNKTTRNQQETQERIEALNYAQAQVERLKSAAIVPANVAQIFGAIGSSPFCIDGSGDPVSISGGVLPAPKASYPNECQLGDGKRYRLGIIQASANVFQVYATWDRFGAGENQVNIVYRLYQ